MSYGFINFIISNVNGFKHILLWLLSETECQKVWFLFCKSGWRVCGFEVRQSTNGLVIEAQVIIYGCGVGFIRFWVNWSNNKLSCTSGLYFGNFANVSPASYQTYRFE